MRETLTAEELATPRPWKQSGRYIVACDPRETIVFEVVGAIENPTVQADVDLTLAAVNAARPPANDLAARVKELEEELCRKTTEVGRKALEEHRNE